MIEVERRDGIDFIGTGVSGIILNKNFEILLLKRIKPPQSNYWCFPGGKIEFNETAEDAIIRECKEEIGVDVCVSELLCISNHIIKDEKQHWLTPVFLIKINDGIPVNKELNKHSDMKWFHLNNLPSNLTNCTNDGIKSLKKNFSFDFVSDIHY